MSGAMGAEDSATVKAPKIEVREILISADYTRDKNRHVVLGSEQMITQYAVIVDGSRVDSFMTRARAEKMAAQLREKAAGR